MPRRKTVDTQKIIRICRQYGISRVGIFGSVARHEDTSQSDLDLLVKFTQRTSLLGMVRLERELSTALGRKVDLVTEESLSPYIRDRVMADLKVIYEAG